MARRRELPVWLAAVDERRETPVRAELTVAAVVIVAAAAVDLRNAIGFSSVTDFLSPTTPSPTPQRAMTLRSRQRRTGMLAAVVGLVRCAALAVTLPWEVIAAGAPAY